MDEMFEVLTLVQTQKVVTLPLVLMGKVYWEGLVNWLRDTMLKYGYIVEADLSLIKVTDDPQETIDFILKSESKRKVAANFV